MNPPTVQHRGTAASMARRRAGASRGRRFWRSIDELADQEGFRRAAESEFAQAFEGIDQADRRAVLKAMGASLALAGATACSGPPDEARPYVTSPSAHVLGDPKYYATAVVLGGYAQPVLGKVHEGRPVKLEGLADHPASLGATDAFTQAALIGLYDPDRSREPRQLGRPIAWDGFEAAMVENAARLDAVQGEGFRLLTGPSSSPTFARQLQRLMQHWPRARWHTFDPVGQNSRLEAARLVWGRPLELQPRFENCEVVVSLDDDFLGPGPHQTRNARAWSSRRRAFQMGEGDCRLFVAEPAPTLTGAMAEDRLSVSPRQLEVLVQELAAALGRGPGQPARLTARQQAWVAECAMALRSKPDASLVSPGPGLSPEVQALALSLNAGLGAPKRTITVSDPILLQPPDGAASLEALAADLEAGRVDTLAIFEANPIYAAPADLNFARAMSRARLRIHLGLHYDETAARCHWHGPLEHDLETWADARAVDGRPSLIQPLVRPFYAVRARSVLMENLQGRVGADARTILLETWKEQLGDQDDQRWQAALQAGFVDEPAPVTAPAVPAPRTFALSPPPTTTDGYALLIRPDPSVWDGSFSNNPWLQELPKPFNKVTWENVIWVPPSLARTLDVSSGDVVRVSIRDDSIEGAVWVAPGLDRNTLLVNLGYGRNLPGRLGHGLGFDAYRLRRSGSLDRVDGAQVVKTGRSHALATTQPHTALQGFDFVRTRTRASVAPRKQPEAPPSFYPAKTRDGPQWGMAIDTDLCIGCNACVTACDAENNVPMVGREQVAKGREMHWMRIDHYFEGAADEPAMFNQPVPCMHCEQAPCEMGCPVNAAVHSSDGLNLQVYNRCIGTRTCSSFCPYKVRRFNWFDFTGSDPPELRAQRNPEVTVRARGVMEKCTYCVQRIEKARIGAKVENRPIAEGEVRTACQQVCPTEAIVFGDVSDPASAVSRLKAQQRNYALLEEVNTRPRTTYLARLSNGGKHD